MPAIDPPDGSRSSKAQPPSPEPERQPDGLVPGLVGHHRGLAHAEGAVLRKHGHGSARTEEPAHVPAISMNSTLVRAKGHDPSGFDDYVGWVRKLTPGEYSGLSRRGLEPLWRARAESQVPRGRGGFFDTPGSPWLPLYQVGEKPLVDPSIRAKLIVSPAARLRRVPPGRVRESLADDTARGKRGVVRAGQRASARDMTTFRSFSRMIRSVQAGVDDDPSRGDLVASSRRACGAAPVRVPLAQEAQARRGDRSMNSFLNQYGERLKSPGE